MQKRGREWLEKEISNEEHGKRERDWQRVKDKMNAH